MHKAAFGRSGTFGGQGGWLTKVTISRLGHREITLALYYLAMAFERVLRFDTQCQITKDIVQPLENHSQR